SPMDEGEKEWDSERLMTSCSPSCLLIEAADFSSFCRKTIRLAKLLLKDSLSLSPYSSRIEPSSWLETYRQPPLERDRVRKRSRLSILPSEPSSSIKKRMRRSVQSGRDS